MKTKTCPYCRGEIMLAAKKCKHCGRWLDENSTNENPTGGFTKDVSNDKNSLNKKNVVLAGLVLLIIGLSVGGWVIIKHNQKKDWEEMMVEESIIEVEPVYSELYEIMYNKIVNSDYRILRADDEKIWFIKPAKNGKYANTMYYPTSNSGYESPLYVYDSMTNLTTEVNVSSTVLNDGLWRDNDYLVINDIEHHNGKITIIISDINCRTRWGTDVYQYNCNSEKWTALFKGCGYAEFSDSRRDVRICDFDCINPEECNANREYVERYETIEL